MGLTARLRQAGAMASHCKANRDPGLACSQLFGLRPIQIKGYDGAYKGRNNGASGRHPKCDQHAL